MQYALTVKLREIRTHGIAAREVTAIPEALQALRLSIAAHAVPMWNLSRPN
jgi:hypothetical protein